MVVIDAPRGTIERMIKTDLDCGLRRRRGVLTGGACSPPARTEAGTGLRRRDSGEKIATLPVPAANLVVSPDGDLLATTAFNGTIAFFDPMTLEPAGDAADRGHRLRRTDPVHAGRADAHHQRPRLHPAALRRRVPPPDRCRPADHRHGARRSPPTRGDRDHDRSRRATAVDRRRRRCTTPPVAPPDAT